MTQGRSLIEAITASSSSEELGALEMLFGTKDYQRLKMISEIAPSNMYAMVVLGVLQRRFKSKVLRLFDEEFLSRQKSRDRQGILEMVEIILGFRRQAEDRD